MIFFPAPGKLLYAEFHAPGIVKLGLAVFDAIENFGQVALGILLVGAAEILRYLPNLRLKARSITVLIIVIFRHRYVAAEFGLKAVGVNHLGRRKKGAGG